MKLTKREERCAGDLSVFVVLVDFKAWFTATDAEAAPRTDLTILERLRGYHDPHIGEMDAEKLKNHLWYLSEQMVGLALFDDKVSVAAKRFMVATINQEEQDDDEEDDMDISNKIRLICDDLPSLETLATRKSKRLLPHLQLVTSFLLLPPEQWPEYEGSAAARDRIRNTPVVHDNAERGVALIEQFNKKHTKREDQLQFLLGVVSKHRKLFPSSSEEMITE